MFIDRAIRAIEKNEKRVMILGVPVNKSDMSKITDALKQNNFMESFTFNPSLIEDNMQIGELFKVLSQHPKLQRLKISLKEPLNSNNIECLRQLIANHSSLKELSFDRNTLTNDTLPKVANAIAHNEQLIKLTCCISTLSNNTIMDTVVRLITDSKTKELYFFPKYTTGQQVINVVNALKNNKTLRSLCLRFVNYENNALYPLVDCIKKKEHSLEQLSLFNIDDATLQQLVEIMKDDNKLQKLTFEMNPTMENLNRIKAMVRNNDTLIKIDYCDSSHSLEQTPEWLAIEKVIDKKIKQNKACLQAQKVSEQPEKKTSRKRAASEALTKPQANVGNLPNKQQRTSEKSTDDSIDNTKHIPPTMPT